MLALLAPAVTWCERRRTGRVPDPCRIGGERAERPGVPGFARFTRPATCPGRPALHRSGRAARFPCRRGIRRWLDSGQNGDAAQCCLIALAKKSRFCSHPNRYRVGQRNLFSTADVMNAGGTNGSFFRSPSRRPNSSSQVMRAEKAFPSSFMNRPVRTMCGCVLPRYEQTSGPDPRIGWVRPDHLSSSPHLERSS